MRGFASVFTLGRTNNAVSCSCEKNTRKCEQGFTLSSLDVFCAFCVQFEVPALLVQLEGVCKVTPDGHVKFSVNAAHTFNTWYTHFPCGRVIIIWDAQSPVPGKLSTKP